MLILISSKASGDQIFGGDGSFVTGGGDCENELMSCREDMTSFMAARSGEGVMWLPAGEGGTGV